MPRKGWPPKPVGTQGAEGEAPQHGCSCPCSCPAAPRTLHRAPPYHSHRLGKGPSLPNLPKPHRTVLLLFLILFYNPRTTKLSWKKSQEHLAQHCHNGLHYDPLKMRINFQCSFVNFISLPSVSPQFASPERGKVGCKHFFSAAVSELVFLSSRLSVVCDPQSDQTCMAPQLQNN